MEERISDKKILVKQDNRLLFVKIIKTGAYIGLLALLIFCIFAYHDDFDINTLKGAGAYIKSAMYDDVLFEKFDIDSGIETEYSVSGVGVSVIQSGFYHYVTGRDRAEFSTQLKYSNPAVVTKGDKSLVFDAGNKSYCIMSTYAVLYSGTADGEITGAYLGENGDYLLITDPSGYRSGVTVFSKRNKERCKWETSDEYIITASLSRKSDAFAYAGLGAHGGEAEFYLSCFSAETGEKMFYEKLDGAPVMITFNDNGDVLAVMRDGLSVFDRDGNILSQTHFTDELFYISGSEDVIMTVFKQPDGYETAFFADNGELLSKEKIEPGLRACAFRNGVSAYLFDGKVGYFADGEMKEAPVQNAKDIMIGADGVPIMVFADRIERTDYNDAVDN